MDVDLKKVSLTERRRQVFILAGYCLVRRHQMIEWSFTYPKALTPRRYL